MLKRCDIVRFKCGFWGDANDFRTGRLGIIEYSYGEKYGNGEPGGGYCVADKETGDTSCWWDADKLEFVSEGGEEELLKVLTIRNERLERETNLEYIKQSYLYDGGISSTSILTLFREIGYASAFQQNGEFFVLYRDWAILKPIFDDIFYNRYDKMIDDLQIFHEEYRTEYKKKCIELFHKVNG